MDFLTTKKFSGVVLNQNQKPALDTDFVSVTHSWLYQEFYMPDNFTRGTSAEELRIPDITGFQILVGVDEGYDISATLDWTLQYFDTTWKTLGSGTQLGAPHDGDKVWMDVYFDQSVHITNINLASKFRIGIQGRNVSGSTVNQEVPYDGTNVLIGTEMIPVSLYPNIPVPLTIDGVDGFVVYDDNTNLVFYSIQQGVNKVWYSYPNPISGVATGVQRAPDDFTPVSFAFRILGLTADEGVDFLGNTYRSVVIGSSADSVSTFDQDVPNSYWLSKPNPSRFAVESRYFDMGDETTIDRIMIDPITPGPYFTIYWCNDGDPGTNDYEWEDKIWTRVKRSYSLNNRETYALPEPVTARYIKIEFSNLQAKSYTPGDFQKPIAYKKFPKWILNFFALNGNVQASDMATTTVGVVFNALDLAYNYYLDDLNQEPDQPTILDTSQINSLSTFFSNVSDLSDQVDPATLSKINTNLLPYTSNQSFINTLLNTQYAAESINTAKTDPTDLRSEDRSQLVSELSMPDMYFYVDSKHRYREVLAKLTYDRAYFVGVREVAFIRDRYTIPHDAPLYIESANDELNIDINEFTREDGIMVV